MAAFQDVSGAVRIWNRDGAILMNLETVSEHLYPGESIIQINEAVLIEGSSKIDTIRNAIRGAILGGQSISAAHNDPAR
jgi:hypothetical protein